jgi:hypothetical protein
LRELNKPCQHHVAIACAQAIPELAYMHLS